MFFFLSPTTILLPFAGRVPSTPGRPVSAPLENRGDYSLARQTQRAGPPVQPAPDPGAPLEHRKREQESRIVPQPPPTERGRKAGGRGVGGRGGGCHPTTGVHQEEAIGPVARRPRAPMRYPIRVQPKAA
jgi:hypothetical protein